MTGTASEWPVTDDLMCAKTLDFLFDFKFLFFERRYLEVIESRAALRLFDFL